MSEGESLDRAGEVEDMLEHLCVLSTYLSEQTSECNIDKGIQVHKSSELQHLVRYIYKKEESLKQSSTLFERFKSRIISLLNSDLSMEMEITKLKCLLIMLSGYFDHHYYQNQAPDCGRECFDCALHYLLKGWKDGLNPSVEFNGAIYIEIYPDVKEASINPLLHFMMYGQEENRATPRVMK